MTRIHDTDQLDHCRADDLLTTDEVATILRIPVATLRYWRHLRTGPDSFRVGRHVRYRRDALNAWIAARIEHDIHNVG